MVATSPTENLAAEVLPSEAMFEAGVPVMASDHPGSSGTSTNSDLPNQDDSSDGAGIPVVQDEQIEIYYKRDMPDICIAHNSEEGLKIFRRAIKTKYMTSYFKLMEQFHTQLEPWLCGFGSLTNVLNALEVDPGRLWKLCWRWYDEAMIRSCVSLSAQVRVGIDFDAFGCTARSNHLDVEVVRVSPYSSIKHFRQSIRRSCRSTDTVLVCSYFRETMQQTGTGHYAPIGGYDRARDLILILDNARFKLPPHWVPVDLMWKAMSSLDEDTGLPRGYFIFRKNMSHPTLRLLHGGLQLLQVPCRRDHTDSYPAHLALRKFFANFDQWLAEPIEKSPVSVQAACGVVELIEQSMLGADSALKVFTVHSDLLRGVHNTKLYKELVVYLHGKCRESLAKLSVISQLVSVLCSNDVKCTARNPLKSWSLRVVSRTAKKRHFVDAGSISGLATVLSVFVISLNVGQWKRPTNGQALGTAFKDDETNLPESFLTSCRQQLEFLKRSLLHEDHEPSQTTQPT